MKTNDEQRSIVAYLDGLYPIGDLRQAKVNALREPHKGVILRSASGASRSGREPVVAKRHKGVLLEGVAPVLWAPSGIDIMPKGYIVPECSEWDAVRALLEINRRSKK